MNLLPTYRLEVINNENSNSSTVNRSRNQFPVRKPKADHGCAGPSYRWMRASVHGASASVKQVSPQNNLLQITSQKEKETANEKEQTTQIQTA